MLGVIVIGHGPLCWTKLTGCSQSQCEYLARRLGVRVGICEGLPALEGAHEAASLQRLLPDLDVDGRGG